MYKWSDVKQKTQQEMVRVAILIVCTDKLKIFNILQLILFVNDFNNVGKW